MRSLSVATISGLALGLTAASAFAADLPAKAPIYKAPPMVAAYNWNGFYVGGNVGWGWADHNSDSFTDAGDFVASTSSTRSGVLGGGQIGYNWMATENILLGIEGDLSGADIKGTTTTTTATGTATSSGKDDWFGTVRGRVGYAFNNWLVYGTGGAAWMHDQDTRTVIASLRDPLLNGQASSVSSILTGWTAGGGVEVGITPNWTVKAEYLHMDFGSYTYHYTYSIPAGNRVSNQSLTADIVRFGFNYKF
jgi:outer membrane immunogenic protein